MPEYILGIDFGQKRIGLAVGQTLTRAASALTTINNDGGVWNALKTIIEEWQISQIVLGLPLDMDGEDQEITRQTRKFRNRLDQHTQLPIHWVDERLTSYEAERQFQSSREMQLTKAKDKHNIDAKAAQIILQSWLDHCD